MSSPGFYLHGLMLGLVWFVIVNAAAAFAVARIVRLLDQADHSSAPSFWLVLRLFPAGASSAVVAVLFFPSYWVHEPRNFAEGFQPSLAAVAVAALTIVVVAVARGATAWRHASLRAAAWMRIAQPIALAGVSLPAFRIDADVPVMALAGVFKPRLFISRGVVAALTEEELAASVAHEVGHRRRWDNFKRLLLLGAPDLLTSSLTRDLDRRWAAAAEHDADRRAFERAHDSDAAAGVRVALASAIVKVARMMPPVAMAAEPISTLVDGSDIEARVRRLLDLDGTLDQPHRARRGAALALAAAAGATAAAAAAYAPLLWAVHEATEFLVHSLP